MADSPNLDWPQVIAEADEFLKMLRPSAVSDGISYDPMTNIWLLQVKPRLDELSIRLEVYGRRVLPELSWQLDAGSRADRQHARQVVGIDGSDGSGRALALAVKLAARHRGHIHSCYVAHLPTAVMLGSFLGPANPRRGRPRRNRRAA